MSKVERRHQLLKEVSTPQRGINSPRRHQLPKEASTPQGDINSPRWHQLPKEASTPQGGINSPRGHQLPKEASPPQGGINSPRRHQHTAVVTKWSITIASHLNHERLTSNVFVVTPCEQDCMLTDELPTSFNNSACLSKLANRFH